MKRCTSASRAARSPSLWRVKSSASPPTLALLRLRTAVERVMFLVVMTPPVGLAHWVSDLLLDSILPVNGFAVQRMWRLHAVRRSPRLRSVPAHQKCYPFIADFNHR